MTRRARALHFLAAVTMAFVASMVWVQPAQAAPGQGMCSLEEWRNPASFSDCAKRTRDAVKDVTGCVSAPTPGSPTSGMAGWFTSRPESSLRDGVGGQYSQYGVGGYGLDTYDIGCLGTIKHPDLTFWNTAASAQFNTAAAIMGASNGLREMAYDPGSMWGWSDNFVKATTNAIYHYVFTPFGAIMLAIVGGFLMWRARHGHMSEAMKVSAWAIFMMVLVTGVARWPVEAADAADAGASKGLAVVHHVLGPAPQDIPADQCVLGAAACKDNRSVATRASDVAVEAVLYRTWLRAMLGTADSDTAKKYGPALFDATSMTWGEAARANQNVTLRQQVIEGKAATFNAVAEQIRAEDPLAYEHLQGLHGSDRAGSGIVALLAAIAFAAFDMSSSVVILLAFLIFRIAIILLPLLGTVAVFLPAAGPVRRLFHMTTAAAVNVLVFGAGAGLYLTFVVMIFGSSLPGAGQVVAVAICGVVSFLILKPARHLIHTVTGRSRSEATLTARLIKAGKDNFAAKNATTGDTGRTEPTAGAAPGASAPRPESRPSGARRIATAAFPTVAATTSNPYVAAAADAVRGTAGDRPEGKAGKVRAVVGAVATVAATAAGGPAAGTAASATITASRPSPRPRPRS